MCEYIENVEREVQVEGMNPVKRSKQQAEVVVASLIPEYFAAMAWKQVEFTMHAMKYRQHIDESAWFDRALVVVFEKWKGTPLGMQTKDEACEGMSRNELRHHLQCRLGRNCLNETLHSLGQRDTCLVDDPGVLERTGFAAAVRPEPPTPAVTALKAVVHTREDFAERASRDVSPKR